MTQFIVDNNIGAWASILGVLIAIFGFWATIYQARKSKTAAEQARLAAENARESIKLLDTVTEFSSALAVMEEIKRLQRNGAWEILLDRYSALRKSLISIRAFNPDFSIEQNKILQRAITHFAIIENKVDHCLNN